jgi:hypothetical protein
MGLFDNINLRVKPSLDSSLDLRLLDQLCDHKIVDEFIRVSGNQLFNQEVYSGGAPYTANRIYSGYDPSNFTYIYTKYPYLKNSAVSLLENPNFSSFQNPIVEILELPLASGVDISGNSIETFPFISQLMFPPVPNSLSIKQIITTVGTNCGIDDVQTLSTPFINYSLSQLNGIIIYPNSADASYIVSGITIPTTLQITYVADEKLIHPKTKDLYVNWEWVGYGKNNIGIFRVFARAFTSPLSNLFIRYSTIPSFCPRCYGTQEVIDLQYDTQGRLLLVYDFIKLIQDFFKRLLTKVGSNPFQPLEGTRVPGFIGNKVNPGTIKAEMVGAFTGVVNVLASKQAVQIPIQGISTAEQIESITQLSVSNITPTDVSVNMVVKSQSKDVALINATIKQ